MVNHLYHKNNGKSSLLCGYTNKQTIRLCFFVAYYLLVVVNKIEENIKSLVTNLGDSPTFESVSSLVKLVNIVTVLA